MEQPRSFGRTVGDTVVELLHSWKLLFGAIALGSTLFLLIRSDAEPGSTIEILGIKYQRAKAAPPAPVTHSAIPDSYILPKGAVITVEQESAMPILDGTLALEPIRGAGSTVWLSGVSLVGPNISKIKIATRAPDGRPGNIGMAADRTERVELEANSYQEIEYRGRYFSLAIISKSNENRAQIVISQINEPTLDLLPTSKIQKVEVGGE